nr:hypothetical protein CFP56_60218 [Quercus suber]
MKLYSVMRIGQDWFPACMYCYGWAPRGSVSYLHSSLKIQPGVELDEIAMLSPECYKAICGPPQKRTHYNIVIKQCVAIAEHPAENEFDTRLHLCEISPT